MKRFASALCFLLALAGAGEVSATDSAAIAVEGAYLLFQNDHHQRILSLDRGGNVSQVSEQQSSIGFTVAQGTWTQVGPDSVRARIVDFGFQQDGKAPSGPTVMVYTLTFADERAGKYQTVKGSFAGETYAAGQNPLAPSAPPVFTFDVDFEGQRITAD